MTVRMLIKDSIPPLLMCDGADRALVWMSEFGLQHLPVVENGRFMGLLSESEILPHAKSRRTLAELAPHLEKISVGHQQHVFDAVTFVTRHALAVVPVVEEDGRYAGLVTLMDLIEAFSVLTAVHAEGGIIEMEVDRRDYMLSEIAKLVEANDAGIISLSAVPSIDGSKIDVTLKVNRTDLTRILEALNRYHYNITGYFHQSEFSEDLQDRYEAFMKYLKI